MSNEQEPPQKAPNEDWNKDRFPTSATPVFRGLGLLFALIAVLCVMVYLSSDNEAEQQQISDQKDSIQDEFLADDQFSDEN